MPMMEEKPVYFMGVFLCTVKVFPDDQKPDLNTVNKINIRNGSKALYDALSNVPFCPNEELRNSQTPWIQLISKEISNVLGYDSRIMEENIVRCYISTHGMDQILKTFGVNIDALKEEIHNMENE